MINGITEALKAVRNTFSYAFVLVKTYYGKAYKTDAPEGVIAYKTNVKFTNSFGLPDETDYFILHRRAFWTGWAEHCGLAYNSSRAAGLTISYEIYNDMKYDKTFNPQLFITNENTIHMLRVSDVIKFVESNKTLAKNQNHGFMEIGIPISLGYGEVEAQ